MSLSSKTIIITGASGRIGSSLASKLFDQGANLILSDISIDNLRKKFKHLSSTDKKRLLFIESDITRSDQIDHLIQKSIRFSDKIYGAVHCAYPTSEKWGTSFEELSPDFLAKDLYLQLGSSIIFSQKVLSRFEEQRGGNLILISSIQGIQAPKFEHYEGSDMISPIEYSAIKAGIISITKWLAKYYKNKNIRINCISPGGILDDQPKQFIENYRKSCSNIGLLLPDDVASSIIYLLSESSKSINGHNLVVDDGWSL